MPAKGRMIDRVVKLQILCIAVKVVCPQAWAWALLSGFGSLAELSSGSAGQEITVSESCGLDTWDAEASRAAVTCTA